MKKIILSAVILLGLAFTAEAQNISKNALGFRLGSTAEISYQRALGKNNRIEADLGWKTEISENTIKLEGLYQWVWDIDEDFNWYTGVGGGIGSRSYTYDEYSYSRIFALVSGDVGIELGFKKVPVLLSLDVRPEVGTVYYRYGYFGFGIGFGIKYKF